MSRPLLLCRHSLNILKWGSRSIPASSRNVSSISPALITRARNIAAEHDKLSAQILESYDSKLAKRIGELASVSAALKKWQKATTALNELETLINDPATDPELRSIAVEDIDATNQEVQDVSKDLTTSLTPVHPFASLPCFLEIRPGAGGSEAAIFAGDLLQMYKFYCKENYLRATLISSIRGDTIGTEGTNPLQEAVLEISNPNSYGLLRCESGVHRVQRVPATEKQGRTHTSAVSVMVLPSFPDNGQAGEDLDIDDPESDYYVNPSDVRTDVMRASGAGGQHVNKTDSAVRLTHIPTSTVVAMQESRSQQQNRTKAWQILRSRLAQAKREKREEEMMNMRLSVVGIAKMGRGDKVRTYNYGQQRVTDHRSGLTLNSLDDVMAGGQALETVMASVRDWLADQEIMGLVAEEEAAAAKFGKGK